MMVAWNRYSGGMRNGQNLIYFIKELTELAGGLVTGR